MSDMNANRSMLRLLINGKSAQSPPLREAVEAVRKQGVRLEVQVTWEAGDAAMLTEQAGEAGASRLIVAGGDGTVNEAVNGLMRLPREARPALGILPMGTANDLATGLGIPEELKAALSLALTASPRAVDVLRVGDHHFLNMLSAGFGAEITASTPKSLKRLLGGGAYSLMGALKAWRFHACPARLEWPGGEGRRELFLLAIGNGAQAGGGQQLSPMARLDDGLLEVLAVRQFSSLAGMRQMLGELRRLPASGEFVEYWQTDQIRVTADKPLPLTLDGEPHRLDHLDVELAPGAIDLLAPNDCPLLEHAAPAP
ncbi:lipid kinase YegS [Onishia taeanensis]|uniref:lipid kinase YegS n=2 Tax=Halomonadaceae TaxID=28256 RepID=UPI0015835965|nr:lipid kinase YegS [Halomonas taeanensis]MDI4639251.1 lipid kinase YegS [Halomonas sp. BMC7]NUJ60242.1 lipid kinase YegS [Halomonas taeanensis]